ncbi:hypothetical protein ACQP1O_10725 [Nocardia sp. CA-151230]|uniref:hypothetical protein n=1 Tax=Nocardia sp. CA-151230 TaxID=3239982 RepID=UPI003D92E075
MLDQRTGVCCAHSARATADESNFAGYSLVHARTSGRVVMIRQRFGCRWDVSWAQFERTENASWVSVGNKPPAAVSDRTRVSDESFSVMGAVNHAFNH